MSTPKSSSSVLPTTERERILIEAMEGIAGLTPPFPGRPSLRDYEMRAYARKALEMIRHMTSQFNDAPGGSTKKTSNDDLNEQIARNEAKKLALGHVCQNCSEEEQINYENMSNRFDNGWDAAMSFVRNQEPPQLSPTVSEREIKDAASRAIFFAVTKTAENEHEGLEDIAVQANALFSNLIRPTATSLTTESTQVLPTDDRWIRQAVDACIFDLERQGFHKPDAEDPHDIRHEVYKRLIAARYWTKFSNPEYPQTSPNTNEMKEAITRVRSLANEVWSRAKAEETNIHGPCGVIVELTSVLLDNWEHYLRGTLTPERPSR